VMAYRGDAAHQIAQASPDQAQMLGDQQVLSNRITLRMIDIARPFGRIRVRTGAQTREQGEVEMVVRVDQAGQDLKPAEIQIGAIDLHVRRHLRSNPTGDKNSRLAASFVKAVEAARALKNLALRRPETRLDQA